MTGGGAPFDRLAGAYRLLLRAYSRRFREAYARELVELFRSRCARALAEGGRAGLCAWVCRAVFDVAWNAPLERLTARRAERRAPRSSHAPRPGDGAMIRLVGNLRFAVRLLVRQPGLSVTLVATLALGTGATTAFFAVLDAALLRPLPYPDADRLVAVRQIGTDFEPSPFAPPYLEDLRERVSGVEGLAGFSPSWDLTLIGLGEPRRVVGAYVSDGLFELLGVRPLAGRLFDATEHQRGGARAVVVSLPFWERHFGAGLEPGGQTLQLDGEPYPVVGVLPAFPLPITSSLVSRGGEPAELWLPFSANPYAELRSVPVMNVVGRLPRGTAAAAAAAELDAVGRSLARDRPEAGGSITLSVTPLKDVVTRDARRTVLTLFGASALLLLIACANVANLLLARATARRHELAVRRSVGASRRHVLEQLLSESLVVAGLGCAAGLLVAWGLLVTLPSVAIPGLPPSAHVRVDLRVAGFAALLTCVTAVAFGLVPAAPGMRGGAAGDLREGARSGGGGGRLRNALVTSEVALAVTLLVGAGLLGRSLWNLVSVDPGFSADGLLAVPVPMAGERYADASDRRELLERLLPELAALPGVSRSGAVNRLPLGGGNVFVGVEIEGFQPADGRPPTLDRRVATPGYFAVMGIPIVEGRGFGPEDGPEVALPAAVVNEAFVRRFSPDTGPLGRRLRLILRSGPGPWLEVVGVSGDVRHHGLDRPSEPEIYVPFAQAPVEAMTLLLRTEGDAASLAAAARAAVWRLDPDLPLDGTVPVSRVVRGSVDEPRLRALVLNGFAALALALAGIGIHGVVAYSVARRTRETGIRIALGASAGGVLRRVIGEGLLHAGAGVLFGLVGAWLLGRLLAGLLFGVEPADPATFATVAGAVLLVAACASYLPARRAARVDPVRALRSD